MTQGLRYCLSSGIANFFLTLAEIWYNYDLDVLNVCKNAFVRQNKSARKNSFMQHLNRGKMFTPLQAESLNAVFKMFQEFKCAC